MFDSIQSIAYDMLYIKRHFTDSAFCGYLYLHYFKKLFVAYHTFSIFVVQSR